MRHETNIFRDCTLRPFEDPPPFADWSRHPPALCFHSPAAVQRTTKHVNSAVLSM